MNKSELVEAIAKETGVSKKDTEECTNDTYLKMWEVIPPKRPTKLGAFVVSVARHIALNMYAAANRIKNGRGYKSTIHNLSTSKITHKISS